LKISSEAPRAGEKRRKKGVIPRDWGSGLNLPNENTWEAKGGMVLADSAGKDYPEPRREKEEKRGSGMGESLELGPEQAGNRGMLSTLGEVCGMVKRRES